MRIAKTITPLILVWLASSLGLYGQQTSEPQFMNEVYYYAGEGKELAELEKGEAKIKNKVKMIGMGGSETVYFMPGERSDSRFSSDSLRFAVKVSGMIMMDPSMFIQLYAFKPSKGHREALLQAQQGRRGPGSDGGNAGIPLRIQKMGEDTFIMIPAKKLPPGEYGFINMMAARQSGFNSTYPVFAFGIDH